MDEYLELGTILKRNVTSLYRIMTVNKHV